MIDGETTYKGSRSIDLISLILIKFLKNKYKIKILFGCASFKGINYKKYKEQLHQCSRIRR